MPYTLVCAATCAAPRCKPAGAGFPVREGGIRLPLPSQGRGVGGEVRRFDKPPYVHYNCCKQLQLHITATE